jgi:hypothetical protein
VENNEHALCAEVLEPPGKMLAIEPLGHQVSASPPHACRVESIFKRGWRPPLTQEVEIATVEAVHRVAEHSDKRGVGKLCGHPARSLQ